MASFTAQTQQELEVAEVMSTFPGRCFIIKDTEMFTHVVTLQLKDIDVALKFHLKESYPSTLPKIIVHSASLTEDRNEELTELLNKKTYELIGQSMMQKLVTVAESWLDRHGIKPGKTVNAKADVFLTSRNKTPEKQKESFSDSVVHGTAVTTGNFGNTASAIQGTGQVVDDDEQVAKSANNWLEGDKLRANYFLAVRITNSEIFKKVKQIQDHVLNKEPIYKPFCYPHQALHVTVCTLGLDTPEQIAHASKVLRGIEPELSAMRPRKPFQLAGVGNFFNKVVYGKVTHNQQLMDFAGLVRSRMREAGVEIRENFDYNPHMTIMKVSGFLARQNRVKNVDPCLYRKFTHMNLGEQHINAVYLCSMSPKRREDGFYICPAEIHFQ